MNLRKLKENTDARDTCTHGALVKFCPLCCPLFCAVYLTYNRWNTCTPASIRLSGRGRTMTKTIHDSAISSLYARLFATEFVVFVMFINTVLGLHLLVAIEIVVSQKASMFTKLNHTNIFLLAFHTSRSCNSPTINERLT